MRPTSDEAAYVAALARKYLWWEAIDEDGHSMPRALAQIMRFAVYDDLLRLESLVTPSALAEVMINSAPGWFDDRSWDFWRGRLSHAGVRGIPERRPIRTFARADML